MYWGDASLDKIEMANLDGTGRRLLGTETTAHYFAFTLHGGNIYITDWARPTSVYFPLYVYYLEQVSK